MLFIGIVANINDRRVYASEEKRRLCPEIRRKKKNSISKGLIGKVLSINTKD